VANPHFGEIGDVWKHLVVGDVLDRVRPARYWETHAGSGTYALDRSWEREYGVFTLLREAPRAPAINASRFLGLVRTLPPRDDGVPRYPASARLAMEVLGDGATYLLCDLDPGSVADLTRTARALDLHDLTRVELADGLATVWAAAQALTPDAAVHTLVLLDPFDEKERSIDDMDSFDLFTRLVAGGFPTVMWHGYDDIVGRDAIRTRGVVDGVALHTLDIETAFLRGGTTLDPGVPGCGMLLANLPIDAVDHVERLGRQLEACYDEVLMPDGSPGPLYFSRADLD
jgi:23S rRNA (adenine2030-N6)-methyltransferase